MVSEELYMVKWFLYFKPEVRLNIMAVGLCIGRDCSPHGRQEIEKGPESRDTLQSTPPASSPST
jgi:hypothetical protein